MVWRGWVAPPGISDSQRDELIELFQQVMDDPQFHENYIVRFGMRPGFMAGEKLADFMAEKEAEYRRLLSEAGILKG